MSETVVKGTSSIREEIVHFIGVPEIVDKIVVEIVPTHIKDSQVREIATTVYMDGKLARASSILRIDSDVETWLDMYLQEAKHAILKSIVGDRAEPQVEQVPDGEFEPWRYGRYA